MESSLELKLKSVTAVRAQNNSTRGTYPDNIYGEEDDDDNSAFLFKLIIIGDSGVGKSCLLARLTK
jgi:small GTP-binding protein